MGDSMLAWNRASGRSVSHKIENLLGVEVLDRSVSGAQVLYALPVSGALGLSIPKQYVAGKWDWVIVNGGGNDLWLGCGCIACDTKLDRLVSRDGVSGAIPMMVTKLEKSATRVLYVGYLRTPGKGSPIDHCANDGDELEARLTRMARANPKVFFLSLRDLVPQNDLSYHDVDRIHPSFKGSSEIARRIADFIKVRSR